jgi:hypothetical protein
MSSDGTWKMTGQFLFKRESTTPHQQPTKTEVFSLETTEMMIHEPEFLATKKTHHQ